MTLPKTAVQTAVHMAPRRAILGRATLGGLRTAGWPWGQTACRSTIASSLPDFSLAGKVAVVSGGGGGLGRVQAEALAEAGAHVHVLDKCAADGKIVPRIVHHQLDVRDADGLARLLRAIADEHGRLDGLVAAAGIQQETAALGYGAADFDKMLGVNVTGVFLTAQAVAREMVRLGRPGSLVLVGSMSGTVANRGLICPAYNASKAAVIQLARNLASEWGQHGIRVNTLSPGYIVTAMTDALFQTHPGRRAEWAAGNMLNRLSMPQEYRGATVFLLSDASSFMTGSDLRIDGGHCAW